ncbi:hypothetical protein X798_01104 [Onchocerca flexuosa]|uniref:Uncharacterized protein n=1 Tax=Onchocerca flexuosa TaxID=387005 RepID=A0A238C388_9BILA|nr:hypothetical protein X798_01104 [Onchocerca flexuosa]
MTIRRNFWKSANLLRRRSTSDTSLKYTWSYFNPGFCFVEDEVKTQESDCNAAIQLIIIISFRLIFTRKNYHLSMILGELYNDIF